MRGRLAGSTMPCSRSFFPHLIAGPIVRASELVPQFATPRDPSRIEAARAFELIVGGLLKKVVLAAILVVTGALVSGQSVAPFIYYRF